LHSNNLHFIQLGNAIVKTIYFGGDFEIWPEENAGWDSGKIQLSSDTVYTVEVKFTSGSKVHLTQRQSERARDCK